jgi:hypothetical protein
MERKRQISKNTKFHIFVKKIVNSGEGQMPGVGHRENAATRSMQGFGCLGTLLHDLGHET